MIHDANLLDYAIIAILLLSMLVGVIRGLLRELGILAIWALSAAMAFWGAPLLMPYLKPFVPGMPRGVAIGILFVVGLVGGHLMLKLLGSLLIKAKLGGLDMLLGAGFGVVRGGALIMALYWAGSMTAIVHRAIWKESVTLPYVKMGTQQVYTWWKSGF